MWKAFENWIKPDLILDRITEVSLSLLSEWSIKGIILDVDNTLLAKTASIPDPDILEWVTKLKLGLDVIIVSNNIPSKIHRAAHPLDLPYVAWTIKPLPWYFVRALKRIKLNASQVCVIGDQLFTDILGGKLVGAKTIYVRPISLKHEMLWTKAMRCLERQVMKKWTTSI